MTTMTAYHKIRRDGGKFEARAGSRVLGTFDSEIEADSAIVQARARRDAGFSEEDHPRDKDGKFSSGGASGEAEKASQHAFEMSGRAAASGRDSDHAAAQKAHMAASRAHAQAAKAADKAGDSDRAEDHREAAQDHRYGAENHQIDRDNIKAGKEPEGGLEGKTTVAMQKAGKSPIEIAASHRAQAEKAMTESREAKASGDDVHAEAMQHVAAGFKHEADRVENGSVKGGREANEKRPGDGLNGRGFPNGDDHPVMKEAAKMKGAKSERKYSYDPDELHEQHSMGEFHDEGSSAGGGPREIVGRINETHPRLLNHNSAETLVREYKASRAELGPNSSHMQVVAHMTGAEPPGKAKPSPMGLLNKTE